MGSILSGASGLQCEGVTVRFGGLTALDGLDLSVQRGEILGLIGPNGSGKTTFFNALTGLYRTAAGRIVFDGHDLTGQRPQVVFRAGMKLMIHRNYITPLL